MDDFCPLTGVLPDNWYCPVTILDKDYFEQRNSVVRNSRITDRLADAGKIQMEIFEDEKRGR